MSEKNNHVVFKGQISPDASAETVKEKLANLFKVNIAQAEAMLSGKPVYIKKNVDLATAKKYQAAMQKAGAIANIVSPEQSAAAPDQAKPPAQQASSSNVTLPGSSASTAVPDTEAPQSIVKIDASAADISTISMAETGAELQSAHEPVPVPALDTAELSLADAGEGKLSHNNDVAPLEIDTSELSLE